jgi:membrane AbrB-like protein
MLITIAIGSMGGGAFFVLNLPLPWMLGAIFTTILAALIKLPLFSPSQVRPFVVAVIGVMLGSEFQPDSFSQINQWIISLIGLFTCIALSAFIAQAFLRRWGGMDPVTALFSAMPGGLVEMVEIGRAEGGDDRAIILNHTCRIVLAIAAIAFWFRLVLGLEVDGIAPLPKGETGFIDLAILAACAVLGAFLGTRLKLPAPTFLGPLVLSATVHMAGLTNGGPPIFMIICAQILLGVIVGCRFEGIGPARFWQAIKLAVISTALMLVVALGLAFFLSGLIGKSTEQIFLAYAPGGLSEMSLVALSMNADAAYVATHHLVRIVILLALASTVLARVARRVKGR